MMSKLVVSMNTTLDGFIAGPHCELDWHFNCWDAGMGQRLTEELNRSDSILLGRVTYQAMAAYWPQQAISTNSARDDIPFADLMNRRHKIVFSNTLSSLSWQNSSLLSGPVDQALRQFKATHQLKEGNIISYGSGKLVSALIRLGLVDEFQLWVHPILLGSGRPLIRELRQQLALRLQTTQVFSSGVVLLQYKYTDCACP
ncbi:MAG: dihydrofolate reductase family protein [Candidatus Pseudobacter hemicellulosilyticus]|uniref:Dihydrofolate reductase family protein n=1 Tax=Candidatus Pseudobacter hemicellulosilyticus TaxID=3121375 RepID=A0AAJ5WX80_9BACT|nr:MAG: dihydrofolate reductase family protein [Pseudobacter sp.]